MKMKIILPHRNQMGGFTNAPKLWMGYWIRYPSDFGQQTPSLYGQFTMSVTITSKEHTKSEHSLMRDCSLFHVFDDLSFDGTLLFNKCCSMFFHEKPKGQPSKQCGTDQQP